MIFAYMQTRSPGAHGTYASVQPLRFEGGAVTTKRRGRTYEMPNVVVAGREILYIVYFALPRFMNLDFETKMITIFHELHHIGPKFNGDIRRLPGKKFAHGSSRTRFNEAVGALAQKYLALPGAADHTAFLRLNFKELEQRHGEVMGIKVRPPKPYPLP
jgi:predicted metallopeptidase